MFPFKQTHGYFYEHVELIEKLGTVRFETSMCILDVRIPTDRVLHSVRVTPCIPSFSFGADSTPGDLALVTSGIT